MANSVVQRYLRRVILDDALADSKMAFISGPRQVGKTTLGRSILKYRDNEMTWDDQKFRRAWVKDPVASVADRAPGPVLLDEIHKDRRWKSRLKGLYDLRGDQIPIVVTGSARLDIFRRGGDSLMGRYLPYRLFPFTCGERDKAINPNKILQHTKPTYPFSDLLRLGGFPEPLLKASEAKAKRWTRLRSERLLREDIRDLRNIRDTQALRVLLDLLPERVGSLLSINSLREDVGVAYATIRDWIILLHDLYYVFTVRPYARSIARAIRAEPKLYFYDILSLDSIPARRENLSALHLLKACHFWTESASGEFELRFIRTKEKAEIDFVMLRDKKPWLLVECKSGDTYPTPVLCKYAKLFGTRYNFQLVDKANFRRDYPEHSIIVTDYERFLSGLV